MIPIRLKLSNFMPYRENVPALSFAGIRTATICGDNGSGKSSLIDAITWALWGKTRARTDDEVIHQNANYAQVEFEFKVDEQAYRVIRRRARPKTARSAGQSSLQLDIADNGVFKPVSGDAIKETEKKIVEILHMDYDTFINSAYLRQGHADQFTVAQPAKRKDVLANILGLSLYDRLETRAKEEAARCELLRAGLENELREINAELSHRPEYEAEWEQAQGQLKEIEGEIRKHEQQLDRLRQDREILKGKQQQLAQLDAQTENATRDLNRWQEQFVLHHSRVQDYEKLLLQREEIDGGYSRLESARKGNEELNQKLRLITALKERRHRLELRIMEANQELIKEHTVIRNKVSELQVSFDRASALRGEIQKVQLEIISLDETEETLRRARQDSQNLTAEIRTMKSEADRIKLEIEKIDEKLQLLISEKGMKCPFCGQELGAEHLEIIREAYYSDKEALRYRMTSINNDITVKQSELDRLVKEANGIETKLNQARAALQKSQGELNRQLNEAEDAGKQLPDLQNKLSELEERQAKKDYALTEQEEKQRLDEQIATIDYDAGRHEQLRQELTELERYELPKRRLEEAERQIEREREAAARAGQASREIKDNLESLKQEKEKLSAELIGLPALDETLKQVEDGYRALGIRQQQAREAVGSIREKLNRCTQYEINKAEKERLRSEAAREQQIYRELAEAFGKNGVQVLLIERALPEIEAEANKLLGRMTDNRMHVKFLTQRPKKDGGMIETLDIKISDELGTRDYEMFSGGEAFRINFAIRIALSKVLARRAGARLPTLIIDEGFGTQDATGIEKLKEAIVSIEEDFEKILVITHVEEFRDAFPTRIDVIKTAEGSTIEVN